MNFKKAFTGGAAALLALCIASVASAAEIWVDVNYGGSRSTGAFNKPYKSITTAMNHAAAGDTVICKPGTYVDSTEKGEDFPIEMIAGVSLASQMGPQATILEAPQDTRTFIVNALDNIESTRVKGFLIRSTAVDGTVYIYQTGLSPANHPIIEGNIFDVQSKLNNAAIMVQVGTAKVINNIFYGNGDYYGAYDKQGGIGVIVFDGSLWVANNTFSNMRGAVVLDPTPQPGDVYQVVNNIFVNNTYAVTAQTAACENPDTTIHHSLYFHNLHNVYGGSCDNPANDVLADPLFTVPAPPSGGSYAGQALDFHLLDGSGAINTGDNTAGVPFYVTHDIEGTSRPQGTAFDIGAYERDAAVSGYVKVENISFTLPDAATAAGSIINERLMPHIYVTDQNGVGAGGVQVTGTLTLPDTTVLILVTVTDGSGMADFLPHNSAGFSLPTGDYVFSVDENSIASPWYDHTQNVEISDRYTR